MRRTNTRPTTIYWLFDVRPETIAEHPEGLPFYCGKTVNPKNRLQQHIYLASKSVARPVCIKIAACGAYIEMRVMEIVQPDEDWVARERHWIDVLRYTGHAVNVADGGSGAPGLICSTETRAKISKAKKGTANSLETRAKMSLAKKGRSLPPEHRAKIRESVRKGGLSDEGRSKIVAANKNRVHSPESRAKMSKARKGKPVSLETRAKMSAASKRRVRQPHSPETRAKISAALRTGKIDEPFFPLVCAGLDHG